MVIPIVLLLMNAVLINVAFLWSFAIRYVGDIPRESIQPYRHNFLLLTVVYMLAFGIAGVFRNRFASYWELFRRLAGGHFLGTLFGLALVYVFRAVWIRFPSSVFVISFFTGLFLTFLFGTVVLRIAGRISKRIVILGQEEDSGIVASGRYVDKRVVHKVEDLVECRDADEIVICERIRDQKEFNLLISLVQRLETDIFLSPALYGELLSERFNGNRSSQCLATFLGRKSDAEELLIRATDVICSLLALIVASPLLVVIAVLVKLSSAGPVFYVQERAGKDGKVFTLYKFRTMKEDSGKVFHLAPAREDDPRFTKVGKWLRRMRLDELPQLLNVLKGQMSLVGPRPENLYRVGNHRALQGLRLAVKPGLTGLAQIRSLYDLKPKHKIKYDHLYIQRRSFLLNLYILAKTVPVMFSRKGW